jgi:hypothetical protein
MKKIEYTAEQVKEAVAVKAAATSYPRQGEGWPMNENERLADKILQGRNDLGQTAEEDAAITAAFYADQRAAAERRAAAEAAKPVKVGSKTGVVFYHAGRGELVIKPDSKQDLKRGEWGSLPDGHSLKEGQCVRYDLKGVFNKAMNIRPI